MSTGAPQSYTPYGMPQQRPTYYGSPYGSQQPYSPYGFPQQRLYTQPPQQRLGWYESKEELAYDARLASHEQQADNDTNVVNGRPGGNRGTIFAQVLFNGQNNGQAKTFLDTPERQRWFMRALQRSVNPQTGQIDGRFLRQSVADAYYVGTGVDILPQINQTPLLPADNRQSTVFKKFADPSKPGEYALFQQQSRWSDAQIMADAEWGHDQQINTRITNPGTRSFLLDGLNNPKNFQDYPLVHFNKNTEAYVRGVANDPRPGDRLNQDFLSLMAGVYGNPAIAHPF